ncbi:hypothetical protein AMK59_1529, partial [Oryctes borbonicus]
MRCAVIFVVICGFAFARKKCDPSITTASGTFAPTDKICPGDIIFQEEFDSLNLKKWQHENTLGGGGNWEFQWYTNNRTNSFVNDGVLYIKPTLTADHLGYDALYYATLDVNGGAPGDQCTNPRWYGCSRTGNAVHILNPVKSARLRTVDSFSFKYGRVEIRAKMPAGDWLWPAIWLLPRYNAYGGWPASGEVDIIEARGNRDYTLDGQQIGSQMIGSTLHFGPDWAHDSYVKAHWKKVNPTGYNSDFHVYELVWDANSMNFYVDSELVGGVTPSKGGFWELGGWGDTLSNPWQGEEVMAP